MCSERRGGRDLEKRGSGSRSSRVCALRAEGVYVETEELKEASVVRAKSGSGRAVQDEAQGGRGQFMCQLCRL